MAKGKGSLHLVGSQYSIIVLVFFIPYVIFQPPATVIMRKIGPRKFLTAIVFLWGACLMVSRAFFSTLVIANWKTRVSGL